MTLRTDLDWKFAGMTQEEMVIDWLDRVHPARYGFDWTGKRYLWGIHLVEATERFDRCPTCEEWSPCTVRQRLLPLIRADYAAPEARRS